MANTVRALEIQRDGQNLKFGKNSYPIGHAVSVWVNKANDRSVFLYCENDGYSTFLEFQMRNIEEMNRLIREIVKDDKIRVSLPCVKKLTLITDPQTQDKHLEFAFQTVEDEALHDEFTAPLVKKLYAAGKTADEIYNSFQSKLTPPISEWDLTRRIQKVSHCEIPAEAAYDDMSEGFIETLEIKDDANEPIVQIGYLDKLKAWLITPGETGDQIERYAEILGRQFKYRCTYRRNSLQTFYNHVVEMGVFKSHLEKIFGPRLQSLASGYQKKDPSQDDKKLATGS